MKKTLKNLEGFALLEVALALAVLGIVCYVSMPLITHVQKWHSARTTNAHQVEIMEALSAYILANNRLPCPAPSTNGKAADICTNQKAGFVPYKTHGISKRVAIDGNHHWMTYVAEPSLTAKTIRWIQPQEIKTNDQHIFCKAKKTSDFELLDETNTPCVNAPDYIAVVLISHGKSGGYAMENGTISPVNSTDADKILNANRSGVFKIKQHKTGSAEIFDDTILFASRNILMATYAKYPCILG